MPRRPEPNTLFFFFLPIMLFGNAQFFYRLCSKLCPIMPVNFARESIIIITILIEQEMTILSFTRNKK